MKYLPITDIESTCWRPDEDAKGQRNETIQIGMVVVNLEQLTIDPVETTLYIRPERSTISEFCKNLCKITDVDYYYNVAPTFPNQAAYLKQELADRWDSPDTWASWGDYDRRKLREDSREKFSVYPFGAHHINLKEMERVVNQRTRAIGLGRAVRSAGMEFEGQPHFSTHDARNTARVLISLIRNKKARIEDFIMEDTPYGR